MKESLVCVGNQRSVSMRLLAEKSAEKGSGASTSDSAGRSVVSGAGAEPPAREAGEGGGAAAGAGGEPAGK